MIRQTPFIIPPLPGSVLSQVTPTPAGGALAMIEYSEKSVVRLVRGNPRNPTDMIEFGDSAVGVFLADPFTANRSSENIIWSGNTTRRSGQKRVRSGRSNSELELRYFLYGDSPQEINALSNRIIRFFETARRYQEEGQEEPVYLQYRWYDGLNDLPPPAFGQWSTYLEVLAAEVQPPAELTNMAHSAIVGELRVGEFLCSLICEATAKGLRERIGTAVIDSTLDQSPDGVISASTRQTFGSDPGFENVTNGAFDNWTAGGGATAVPSKGGLLSDNIAIIHGGGTGNFFSAISPGTNIFTQSALVKRVDGTAVLATDFDFTFISGTNVAPTVTAYRDGWYWCYATSASITPTQMGMANISQNIIVDYIQIQELAFATYPALLKSTPRLGDDSRGSTNLELSQGINYLYDSNYDEHDIGNTIFDQFTLVMWITPFCDPSDVAVGATPGLFRFFASGSMDFYCNVNYPSGQITVGKNGSTQTFNVSLAFGTPTHLAFVQRSSTLEVYQDGASLGTLTVDPGGTAAYTGNGTWNVGSGNSSWGAEASFDAVRVWAKELTTAQVLQLYTIENYAKTAGHIISPMPFMLNDTVYNIEEGAKAATERNNFALFAGLAGNTDSDIDVRLEWSGASRSIQTLWVGRKARRKPYTSYNNHWVNFTGGTISGRVNDLGSNSANNSGDQEFEERQDSANLEVLRGRVLALAAMNVQNNPTTRPFYHFESSASPGTVPKASFIYGSTKTHTQTGSDWKIYSLGDLNIDWPTPYIPEEIVVGCHLVGHGSTEQIDYMFLMPWPYAEIASNTTGTFTIDGTNSLVISNCEAFTAYPAFSTGHMLNYRGPKITLIPNEINYLYFAWRNSSWTYNTTTITFQIRAYYTPRFVFAGGPL